MNTIEDANHLNEISNSTNSPITIYRTSNEYLNQLFSNFSVQDKDVLTVLGSGDQAILSYLKGAKSVDTFDKEKYAYYFFYLRKWTIKYFNRYILDYDLDYKTLIDKVIPVSHEEADALLFWKTYFEFTNYKINGDVFAYSEQYDFLSYYDETKKIIDMFFPFYNIDISKEVKMNKKYDIVILSNILEWAQNKNYAVVRDNINSILKQDGIAVCSYKIFTSSCNQGHRKESKVITKDKLFRIKEYKDKSGYQYRKVK